MGCYESERSGENPGVWGHQHHMKTMFQRARVSSFPGCRGLKTDKDGQALSVLEATGEAVEGYVNGEVGTEVRWQGSGA